MSSLQSNSAKELEMTAPPNHEVSIVIDKKEHKSPSPTTGAALYLLGKVPTGYDLFREVRGKGDDELIPNNSAECSAAIWMGRRRQSGWESGVAALG
jgi:hypothetical protein